MIRQHVLSFGIVLVAMLMASGCGQAKAPAEATLTAVDSSLISGVNYDAGSQALTIEFTDGDSYRYSAVGQDIYDGLMAAESKGSYFQEKIKDKFAAEKL